MIFCFKTIVAKDVVIGFARVDSVEKGFNRIFFFLEKTFSSSDNISWYMNGYQWKKEDE